MYHHLLKHPKKLLYLSNVAWIFFHKMYREIITWNTGRHQDKICSPKSTNRMNKATIWFIIGTEPGFIWGKEFTRSKRRDMPQGTAPTGAYSGPYAYHWTTTSKNCICHTVWSYQLSPLSFYQTFNWPLLPLCFSGTFRLKFDLQNWLFGFTFFCFQCAER